jgi:predicted membrane channel-forming protein YqfA (hemolysin III family)
MKTPHAVAIHAIQVLPALAWLLSFAALPEPRRLRLVRIAGVGYVALVVVSVLQTGAGLAPFDVGVVAAVLYLLGVLLLGAAFLAALVALRKPTPTPA